MLLAEFGEVQIDHRRLEAAMTEVGGDLANRGPAFKHVSGEAVTQGVNGHFLVSVRESALSSSGFHGRPDTDLGHGVARLVHGFTQGDAAGLVPASAGSREQPVRVAVALPEHAQALEQFGRDRDFSLPAALALDNADDQSLTIDVFGFDGEGFAHAQAALIDDGEVGAVATVAEGVEQA